ncbi:MAG TPA: permease-like cell division protein FtsX [Nitrospiraceae bacterium]|jgi:cell division transport system permease protein|nr:permease-like cell division protein FtsX [Nitrospiraceae bacterium]
MRRALYFLREAFANVRVNRTTTVVAVATTAFTLACVGVFLLLYVNLRIIAGLLQEDIRVMIYLDDGLTAETLAEIEQRLKVDRAVASFTYVSKEQALTEFQAQFPSESHLLEGLGQNPLPASYEITLAPQFRSSDSVRRWAERVQTLPGVAQVEYSRDLIETLAHIVRHIELAAIAAGVILSTASVTIIANTIRLTLYTRRDEIEILRLIGATRAFIRIPYLMEGTFLGGLGSALSLAILKMGFEFVRHQIESTGRFLRMESWLSFFPVQICLLLVLAGALLGFVGSFVSLSRFGEARS